MGVPLMSPGTCEITGQGSGLAANSWFCGMETVEGFVKILRDRTSARISAEELEASRVFALATRKLPFGSILISN